MVIERGGEKSDPTHGIKRLTEYSCWANEAWINFIQRVGPTDEFLVTRMSHILLGEDEWFRRMAGVDLDRDVWSVLTFDQMRERLARHCDVYDSLLRRDLSQFCLLNRF